MVSKELIGQDLQTHKKGKEQAKRINRFITRTYRYKKGEHAEGERGRRNKSEIKS